MIWILSSKWAALTEKKPRIIWIPSFKNVVGATRAALGVSLKPACTSASSSPTGRSTNLCDATQHNLFVSLFLDRHRTVPPNSSSSFAFLFVFLPYRSNHSWKSIKTSLISAEVKKSDKSRKRIRREPTPGGYRKNQLQTSTTFGSSLWVFVHTPDWYMAKGRKREVRAVVRLAKTDLATFLYLPDSFL